MTKEPMLQEPTGSFTHNLIHRYKAERGVIKNFMEKLPLYSQALGNHQYEEADLFIRKEISNKLSQFKEPLRKVEEGFIRKNFLNLIGRTEPVTTKLDKLSIELRTASYGLNGLGTGLKPKPSELEKLNEYDYAILKSVEALDGKFQDFQQTHSGSSDENAVGNAITVLTNELDVIERTIKERKGVFLS